MALCIFSCVQNPSNTHQLSVCEPHTYSRTHTLCSLAPPHPAPSQHTHQTPPPNTPKTTHHNTNNRDIHNIFGYYYHLATAQGLIHRGNTHKELYGPDGDRPFVLSRAFFSGVSVCRFLCVLAC